MKAFVIVDVQVNDHNLYEEYKKLTPASIQQFGGKFLVRGGATEIIEGDWKPGRLVVLEFPSPERARAWWSSETYQRAKSIRQRSAYTRMILAEGVPE